MNFCQKCHRPSTNEGLCNDCKKREAQLKTSKIQAKKNTNKFRTWELS